jgi:hypothetical protein
MCGDEYYRRWCRPAPDGVENIEAAGVRELLIEQYDVHASE